MQSRKITEPDKLLLTPEVLRAAYGLVIATEPFCYAEMPAPEDVDFKVMRMRDTSGDYYWDKKRKRHVIRISSRCVSTIFTLIQIMAHEALHVAEKELGTVTFNIQHNAVFRRMADAVCSCHGYDRHYFADVE